MIPVRQPDLELYATAYRPYLGARGAVIHDALAAMLAVDPSLGEYAGRPVRVELRGEHTRGATLWDRRATAAEPERPAVKVAVRADAAAFRERLRRACKPEMGGQHLRPFMNGDDCAV
jgi:purine nucleosidase